MGSTEAEMVRLQFRLEALERRLEEQHVSIIDGVAKLEIGVAQVLECISEHRTFTEHDDEIEEEPEEHSEEESEGEVTDEEGEITEVEPEHDTVEVVEEMLLDDAEDNLNDIPFGL